MTLADLAKCGRRFHAATSICPFNLLCVGLRWHSFPPPSNYAPAGVYFRQVVEVNPSSFSQL
jgi:hypothetical protein